MLGPMNVPKLSDLANDAENQFQLALGPKFRVASNEVLGESQARGGFRLCFADGSRELVVAYGDLQIEVTLNGLELFGFTNHIGFAGNMFSREHFKECLPRIVAASIEQLALGA